MAFRVFPTGAQNIERVTHARGKKDVLTSVNDGDASRLVFFGLQILVDDMASHGPILFAKKGEKKNVIPCGLSMFASYS